MARRPHQLQHQPMYGWALDDRGRPIPIGAAQRGAQGYTCPICNGPMIARKGDVKIHHFAHENLQQCSPERVATIIAGKWLVLELGKRMVKHQPVYIHWELSNDAYTVDIMRGIVAIVEGHETEYGRADIALTNNKDTTQSVINISAPADELALARFASNGITVILLPINQFRSGQSDLDNLLLNAKVQGGWWLLDENQDVSDLMTDPQEIRQILGSVVAYPPYRYWGRLEAVGTLKHVLRVGDHLLWLPYEVWQVAVGGARNRLSNLVVTIQEWPQNDGSVIVLFYVILREKDRAVAIRRFQRGEQVHATLTAAYRMRNTTAEDVARLLATG